MQVMFDLNVLLDAIQRREPFANESAAVCDLSVQHRVVGFVPVHCITTLLYILQRGPLKTRCRTILDWILQNFKIAPCSAADIFHAAELPFEDFEDAVVCAAAESSQCDLIVTRDLADFAKSPVRVLSPQAFLDELYFGGGFVHEPETKYGSDGRDGSDGRNGGDGRSGCDGRREGKIVRPRAGMKNKRGGR